MEIPVYLFTGFLEAGKTRLIQETMEDSEFNAGEPTLILLCEEGEEEFDPTSFAHDEKVFFRTVDSQEEITEEALKKWQKEYSFRRLLVEYNGMWQIGDFYRCLPQNFMVYQEIMVADSTTFAAYNANMRSLTVDKLQGCEMVVFNRVTADTDKMELHKIARGVSRSVNISYEYTDGNIEYDDIVDPLPFDIEADVIDIADRDFAIFFRDLTEEMGKYDGKVIRYRALIGRDPRLPENSFVAGRQIMTCCADDVAYNGFICIGEEKSTLEHGAWAIVEAEISIEKHALYRNPGPILHLRSVTPSEMPEQPVATFY